MTTKKLLSAAVLVGLSACLLTACGGGGSNGMVRTGTAADLSPLPAVADPPTQPAVAETGPCPSPVAADCVADVPDSRDMTGGRQSDHVLVKRGDGQLTLASHSSNDNLPPTVDFRFGGGTTIEAGALRVFPNATLHSNVLVLAAGSLGLSGTMTGNLDNHGYTGLMNTVVGNVANDGVLAPGSSIYGDAVPARVEGNFRQTSNGTLQAVIPLTIYGPMTGGFITVTGRADIDGTLQLVRYGDDWGPYPLPGAPLSLQVLHADGGVFGRFARWISPGLFVTGAVRYLANDVYFDITSISAVEAMAAAAQRADSLTLRSAAHFDAALGNASGWARVPTDTLTAAQQRFLASVGAIQRLQDYGEATRAFDSLSGHGYADAADALLQQAAPAAPELLARVRSLSAGLGSGSWSSPSVMLASGGVFTGQRSGFDQWLGDRLLLGASFGWNEGGLRFDRSGGSARDQSPQWDVYVRGSGNGNTYLFGDVGYGRHQLDFNRQIDLGIVRRAAGTQRSFDLTRAYVEAGRDFQVGRSRLTPFGAVSYAMLHGAGFIEQGSTGFELVAQPSTYQRLNALAGLRLGTDWRSSGGRWTTLNLTAGYRQLLHAHDDARAAFTGAPDVTFALDGMPHQRNTGWMQMSVATGGANWEWLLSYDRQASHEALSLGAKFGF